MFKQLTLVAALGSALLGSIQVSAADQEQNVKAAAAQTDATVRERVYGWQMMTAQERDEFRAQMRNLKTEQERAAFRAEHHRQMQQRAKERGVDMPDEMPMNGRGMGGGMGPGMGSGGGKK